MWHSWVREWTYKRGIMQDCQIGVGYSFMPAPGQLRCLCCGSPGNMGPFVPWYREADVTALRFCVQPWRSLPWCVYILLVGCCLSVLAATLPSYAICLFVYSWHVVQVQPNFLCGTIFEFTFRKFFPILKYELSLALSFVLLFVFTV
jgi:hypothetical protein